MTSSRYRTLLAVHLHDDEEEAMFASDYDVSKSPLAHDDCADEGICSSSSLSALFVVRRESR